VRTILIALEVYQELTLEGALEDEERFGQRMIERILTQLEKVALKERAHLLDVLVRYGTDNSAKLASKIVSAMQEAA
jgi:predicted CopG family antitoxin